MNEKKQRRTTIYDIARHVGVAPSSVSKALNDQPSISKEVKALIKAKAKELNYFHNSNAANLRKGSSKIIGVIVPKINTAFFSEAIAGIEEICYKHNHSLIICQSDESYIKETKAVDTLIHQNVDCILISLSIETQTTEHLRNILNHNIALIQFDRVDYTLPSHIVVNDNKKAAYRAVKHLIEMGYQKIAFLGGTDNLSIYRDRKEGYLKAIKEYDLSIPYNYIIDNALTIEKGTEVASKLLKSKEPPDAFFTISDYSAFGILKVAQAFRIKVPEQLGIMGFSNEPFTSLITPALSSIDQKSKRIGREAATIYFDSIDSEINNNKTVKQIIPSSPIIRYSSKKK